MDTPCIEWTGATTRGYGFRKINRKQVRVHRLAYEAANGPIPPGWDVHHLCHNKLCLNPTHLEALSKSEHTLRHQTEGEHGVAYKTHCLAGHPFDRTYGGRHYCSICNNSRERERARRERDRKGRVRRTTAEQAAATTCSNGHPYDGHNGRQRTCSTCLRAAEKRYRARKHPSRLIS